MTARVIQLQENGFESSHVQTAVKALREGALVVLPTETVYGVAVRADNQYSVEHLLAAKNRSEKNPFTLAFSDLERITRFVPQMSVTAERIARRCLPGPITLVLNAAVPQSAIYQIPESVRKYLMPEDSIGVRVPRNEFTLAVLREADFPVALTSANLAGEVDSTSGQEVVKVLGDKVDLIFDDGDAVLKRPSTVVQFAKNSNIFRVLREGTVSARQLEDFAKTVILFVCSGNTCRSPMAEILAGDILARKKGIKPEELEKKTGILLFSAGTMANDFSTASAGAKHVAEMLGLSLSMHISHPITQKALEYADLIYAMTPAHGRQLLSVMPEIAYKLFVLARDAGGISDPYGGSFEVYETCARQIREELEKEFSTGDFKRIAFTSDL